MTAFVSGHLDLTEEEFAEHYAERILDAINQGHNFCVGDAKGADTIAQQFIAKHKTIKNTLFIAHMFISPRNFVSDATLQGGYTSDEHRDASMTMNSDYDICWVRPGRENSGTAKNLIRRKNYRTRLARPGFGLASLISLQVEFDSQSRIQKPP